MVGEPVELIARHEPRRRKVAVRTPAGRCDPRRRHAVHARRQRRSRVARGRSDARKRSCEQRRAGREYEPGTLGTRRRRRASACRGGWHDPMPETTHAMLSGARHRCSCSMSTTRCSTTIASPRILARAWSAHSAPAERDRYWEHLRRSCARNSAYADYLAALQQFRAGLDDDPQLLQMSSFLLDYPFAERALPACARGHRASAHVGSTGDPLRWRHRVPAAQDPALRPLGRRSTAAC